MMYDSASCSYAGALDLKGPTSGGGGSAGGGGGGSTGAGSNNAGGSGPASNNGILGGGGGNNNNATSAGVKQENWPYRGLSCGSTFQQLKQSVEKAKQALADRGGYLAGAFSPPPRANPSAISPTAAITGESTCNILPFSSFLLTARKAARC